MDHIKFPYRSSSHLPLLHVVSESGAWQKYDLDVEYDQRIARADAHGAVARGDVEFVGGNHVSTYGRRARGDDWLYVGQTMNVVYGRHLCVRPDSGINRVEDLRHKKVGTLGAHPGLNDWLYLKQHGLDVDRDEVELLEANKLGADVPEGISPDNDEFKLWHTVRDRKVDAAFIAPPATIFAADAGLKVIAIDSMPMIYFTTLSTGARFANNHPEIVERFLKGMIEGIHFLKTQPEKATEIIQRRYTKEGQLTADVAGVLYDKLAEALEPKLFPRIEAIANVYEEGKRLDKDAAKINPMELWDLHFIRNIDDSGFTRELYGQAAGVVAAT